MIERTTALSVVLLALSMGILGLTVLPASAAVMYTVTDLGTLPGYASSRASGINDAGQVVGESSQSNPLNGVTHAFLYSGGQMQDLGIVPGYGPNSQANGINNSGQVVGGLRCTPLYNVGDCAFLYSAGQMQALPIGAEYQPRNAAYGINDIGQIVGRNDAGNAFIYYNGTTQELGNLGGSGSTALGINNFGQVVGNANTAGGNTDAFLYSAGQMQDLGNLGSPGGSAIAINNSGQIVGYSYATSYTHAFLYSGGKMQDLGILIRWNYFSSAQGINNAGQVVGGFSFNLIDPYHAFLYSGGAMIDLNTLIDPSSGWTLQDATAINDSGQIVGYGLNSAGQQDAFLLTPTPEPATLSLLAFGGLAILRRRS